jgi:hypothetical protein
LWLGTLVVRRGLTAVVGLAGFMRFIIADRTGSKWPFGGMNSRLDTGAGNERHQQTGARDPEPRRRDVP